MPKSTRTEVPTPKQIPENALVGVSIELPNGLLTFFKGQAQQKISSVSREVRNALIEWKAGKPA